MYCCSLLYVYSTLTFADVPLPGEKQPDIRNPLKGREMYAPAVDKCSFTHTTYSKFAY